MAQIVMIYGQSGTGKSTSLRNFKKGEVSVINVSAKPFPFKADFATLDSQDYEQIEEVKQMKKYHNFAELLATNETWEIK
jgi:hemerythrin superfamily protein